VLHSRAYLSEPEQAKHVTRCMTPHAMSRVWLCSFSNLHESNFFFIFIYDLISENELENPKIACLHFLGGDYRRRGVSDEVQYCWKVTLRFYTINQSFISFMFAFYFNIFSIYNIYAVKI